MAHTADHLEQAQRLSRQMVRAQISSGDFLEAREYLEEHLKLQPSDAVLRRATLLAAIVAYCRPFLTSDAGPDQATTNQLSVNPQKVLAPAAYQLHSELLDLRSQALAHSDHSRDELRIANVNPTGTMTVGKGFDLLNQSIDIEAFQAITEKMLWHSRNKTTELAVGLVELVYPQPNQSGSGPGAEKL